MSGPITKAWLTRGFAKKERLRPGQHARHYLRKQGRIGNLWKPFQQKMLKRWFDRELGKGQLPRITGSGWEIVAVTTTDMGRVAVTRTIRRRVGIGGQTIYKGDDLQVGHMPGHGKDRRPDQRNDPDAVEPQTARYNAWLETVAQVAEED